ncbi:FLJ37770-like protein [Trichonephila clavipes]|nr:FLJ37770-like protein [Trichonephila clavipes]
MLMSTEPGKLIDTKLSFQMNHASICETMMAAFVLDALPVNAAFQSELILNAFVWYKRFVDGRDTIEYDQCCGRPISSRTAKIEKVRNFVLNDRCASLRLMEDSLSTNKETIRTIQHEDLGKTKKCAKFVPHTLIPEQKATGSAYIRYIISFAENDPNFLKSIVTGDESWSFQYDSETKCGMEVAKFTASQKTKESFI